MNSDNILKLEYIKYIQLYLKSISLKNNDYINEYIISIVRYMSNIRDDLFVKKSYELEKEYGLMNYSKFLSDQRNEIIKEILDDD